MASTAASAATAAPSITEYNIRVPKNQKKKYQVMRYNSSLNIDFQKWSQVKIDRENNMREQKGFDDAEQPKFGAGSEFGRDAREEARRKKFGIVNRRYKTEAQPWLIKVKQAGKNYGYRGVREGGIAENASYYVFTHAPDGGIDAYPLQEWYNFQPVQRYKALSAEEAEEEFGRRNKLMNYFSVMTRKRCRGKDDDAELDDPEEAKLKKGGTKKKELKISDMDDWMDSSDEDDESGDEKDDNDKEEAKEEKDKKKKQKEKAKNIKKKKKKRDVDDEAFEESDDGDEEGREVDYISDSSDSESDHEGKANKELKGVSEEKALRNLLSSGSDEDDDEDEKKEKERESDNNEEEGKNKDGEKGSPSKDDKDGKQKKKKKKKTDKKGGKKEETKRASSSEFSSDSDTDSEVEAKRKAKKEAGKGGSKEKDAGKGGSKEKDASKGGSKDKDAAKGSKDKDAAKGSKDKDSKETKDLKGAKESKEADMKESTSGGSSRSGTPTKETGDSNKRKMSSTPEPSLSKKMRLDNFASAPYSASPVVSSEAGITEDAVRRYLMRKPMTTTELLQKFKSKKTGLSSEQLVNVMTQILKRINPVKQTIKGKMYLSIKR